MIKVAFLLVFVTGCCSIDKQHLVSFNVPMEYEAIDATVGRLTGHSIRTHIRKNSVDNR